MTRDDWSHQLRWWSGEYQRRATAFAVRSASTSARTGVLTALEDRDGGYEIDFGDPGPFRESAVVEEHVVAPASVHIVPGVPDHPREEGNHWPQRSVWRLRDCRVDIATSLVFHQGFVIASSGNGWRSARDSAFLSGAGARARSERAPARWPGTLTPMGRPHNYCHFLIESFVRYLWCRTIDPTTVPVFTGPMPGYVTDVLETLDVDHVVVDDPGVVHSDDVLVCDPIPTNWPHPDDYALLRSAVAAAVPVGPNDGPDRIYVTRRHGSRSIRDEQRLEDALIERGFTVVAWERMPFAEQIQTVRGARVIVGPHGTGLTNAVFADRGTLMYEITAGHWWNPSFRHMASMNGQPHRLVQIPATPREPFGNADDAIARLDAAFADPPGAAVAG